MTDAIAANGSARLGIVGLFLLPLLLACSSSDGGVGGPDATIGSGGAVGTGGATAGSPSASGGSSSGGASDGGGAGASGGTSGVGGAGFDGGARLGDGSGSAGACNDPATCAECQACATGQPCANGTCLEPLTGRNVGSIARDDRYLYTQSGSRVPLASGTLTPFVTVPPSGNVFDVDDLNLYVETYAANQAPVIQAAPTSGGSFAPLVTTLTTEVDIVLRAMGGTIYYWQDDTSANFGIYRVPRTGGTPELWVKTAAVQRLDAIPGTVVWSYYLPLTPSGNGVFLKPSTDSPDLNFAFQPLPGTAAANGEFSLDASGIYWATTAGAIMHTPLGGGAATELGQDSDPAYAAPADLALDSSYVYYQTCALTGFTCLVKRLSKSGGAVTTLAMFPSTVYQLIAGNGGVFVTSNGGLHFVPVP